MPPRDGTLQSEVQSTNTCTCAATRSFFCSRITATTSVGARLYFSLLFWMVPIMLLCSVLTSPVIIYRMTWLYSSEVKNIEERSTCQYRITSADQIAEYKEIFYCESNFDGCNLVLDPTSPYFNTTMSQYIVLGYTEATEFLSIDYAFTVEERTFCPVTGNETGVQCPPIDVKAAFEEQCIGVSGSSCTFTDVQCSEGCLDPPIAESRKFLNTSYCLGDPNRPEIMTLEELLTHKLILSSSLCLDPFYTDHDARTMASLMEIFPVLTGILWNVVGLVVRIRMLKPAVSKSSSVSSVDYRKCHISVRVHAFLITIAMPVIGYIISITRVGINSDYEYELAPVAYWVVGVCQVALMVYTIPVMWSFKVTPNAIVESNIHRESSMMDLQEDDWKESLLPPALLESNKDNNDNKDNMRVSDSAATLWAPRTFFLDGRQAVQFKGSTAEELYHELTEKYGDVLCVSVCMKPGETAEKRNYKADIAALRRKCDSEPHSEEAQMELEAGLERARQAYCEPTRTMFVTLDGYESTQTMKHSLSADIKKKKVEFPAPEARDVIYSNISKRPNKCLIVILCALASGIFSVITYLVIFYIIIGELDMSMDIFHITSFTDVLYAMLKVLLPSFVKQGVNILQRGIVILFSSNVKSWINMFLLAGNVALNTVLILFIPMLQVILTQVHYDCAVSLNIFYSTICFTMVSLGVVDPLITIILERIWTRVRRNPYRLNLMTQMRGTVLIFLSCNFFGFFYPSVYLLCAVACLSQYYIIKARLLLEGVKPSYLTVKDVMTVVGSIAFGSTSYLAVSFYGVTLQMFYAFGYDQRYFQIYASSGIVIVACLICLVLTNWSRCGCLGTIEDTGNTYRLSDTPSLVQNLHVYTDSRFPYQMQVYPPAHIPL